jgi:hypothetical protein
VVTIETGKDFPTVDGYFLEPHLHDVGPSDMILYFHWGYKDEVRKEVKVLLSLAAVIEADLELLPLYLKAQRSQG